MLIRWVAQHRQIGFEQDGEIPQRSQVIALRIGIVDTGVNLFCLIE
jgi:hypothetical protein